MWRCLALLLVAGCLAGPGQSAERAGAVRPAPRVQGGRVRLPVLPVSSAPGDVVGFGLQDATGAGVGAGVVSFGQVFRQGQVPAGAALVAILAGQRIPVQVDAKTTYPDGSLATAVLSLAQPGIAPGSTLAGLLSLATPSDPARAAPLDLAQALARYSLAVDITPTNASTNADAPASPVHLDLAAALRAALATGAASFWQQGPLVAQARIALPATATLRVVADITARSDGTISADIQFNNDAALQPTGGTLTYNAAITQNGQAVLVQPSITQNQYQDWHATLDAPSATRPGTARVGSAPGPMAGAVNVQHDVAALERTGVIAGYDLATGISPALLQTETSAAAAPGWGAPLAANGVTQYMPGTGGRGDIGLTTQANTLWLLTQDPAAARYALAQADAAGSVPWHFWDPAHQTWLNTANYPSLWLDPRGGNGPPGGLTQPVSASTGWTTDPAHQPDLSFIPYLLTGSRYDLDQLQAQAAWAVMSQWPDARNNGDANLVNQNQTRGAAWDLRQVDEAALASPDTTPEKAYFAQVSANNWSWLAAQLPGWTAREGEAYGYIPGEYGTAGNLPPWQQDYFASSAIAAARTGNADALAVVKWMTNFLAGRFLAGSQGFNPHDGVAYNLVVASADGSPLTSWAAIEDATRAAGLSNNDGWAQSQGDYAQLARQTLAGLVDLTGDPRAVQAYTWLQSSGAPFIDQDTLAKDPTFNVAPRAGTPRALADRGAAPGRPATRRR